MEETKIKKHKSPWRYLLWIPGIALIDIPLMFGFMYLDTWLLTPEPGKVGHPIPFISMIGMLIILAITAIVICLSLYKTIRQYYINKKIDIDNQRQIMCARCMLIWEVELLKDKLEDIEDDFGCWFDVDVTEDLMVLWRAYKKFGNETVELLSNGEHGCNVNQFEEDVNNMASAINNALALLGKQDSKGWKYLCFKICYGGFILQLKKILIIGTGGTIASIPSEDGFVPGLDANALISMVPGLSELADLECLQIMDLDSSNICPEHWELMAKTIQNNYAKYDGFVITHGTDTMAYSAAAISQMVNNCQKPIVFTGAQLTMGEEGTDAKANIYFSVMTAASDLKGVVIAFGDRVINGLMAKKMCTENFNGFWSINALPLAEIKDNKLVWHSTLGAGYGEGEFSVQTKLEKMVAVIKITPGLSSDVLDYYVAKGYKGLVLESYGAGGVPNADNNWLPALEKTLKAGVMVYCATQCVYDGVHLDRYPIGILAERLGAKSAGYHNVEAILTKLMVELVK